MQKYDKMFESCIRDIARTKRVAYEDILFVKDCRREQIWRHEFIDSYKGTRNKASASRPDGFDANIFTHTYEDLMPRLMDECGFKMLSHPRLEADDIAAIVCKYVRRVTPESAIHIITNDNDYVQLIDDREKVQVMNLQHQYLIDRIPQGMPPPLYLQLKIIGGDKSDNISAIAKNVGPKTAERLTSHPEELARFLVQKEAAQSLYERNTLLMSFDHIPAEFIAPVEEAYLNLTSQKQYVHAIIAVEPPPKPQSIVLLATV